MSTGARTKLVVELMGGLDAGGLAQAGSAWFSRLSELAKVDPVAAGGLAAAMFSHLVSCRPESPAPLDAGFEPTEIERDPRV